VEQKLAARLGERQISQLVEDQEVEAAQEIRGASLSVGAGFRCAIYTRKSADDGLEQDFNSLDAQYEACAAFITSQKAEGWVLLPDRYDDGGLSGGTLERPGLDRLLKDIDRGAVDQILVYKIDRLTRSLADFAKIVERLDAAGATFVAVTQSFNTATSMGRLTLNMLLSFAQFEREVTAQRIRDKIAASKKKGQWMGATVPLGYAADGRSLKIAEPDAKVIRTIYDLYLAHRNVRLVKGSVDAQGLRTPVRTLCSGRVKGGATFSAGHLHYILTNPVYAGRIRHHAKIYPGQHNPLIAPEVWDAIQAQLASDATKVRSFTGRNRDGAKVSSSPLTGRIFDQAGDRLTPSHSKTAKGRRVRYYVSHRLVRGTAPRDPSGWRLPAPELEVKLAALIGQHLARPDFRAGILLDATTDEIAGLDGKLPSLALPGPSLADDANEAILALADRIDIAPGELRISLSADRLAVMLDVDQTRISEDLLTLTCPFQQHKRGVETKLIIGNEPADIDDTLLRNIARARHYFDLVQSGKTFGAIADSEGVSKRRIQQLIELAFLAPDVIRSVREGKQPLSLTSDWLMRHAVPPLWSDQRDLFSTL
jgi:DNA invertase Pin-like site-specific DNA recombinase